MQPLKEAVKVMMRWSNDDWATYHDTQADLIATGAHDEMELFCFNTSAEKTLPFVLLCTTVPFMVVAEDCGIIIMV